MGITVISNVDASGHSSKAVSAVTRGLQGMWYFDTNVNKATNDFSLVSDAKSIVVGAPSFATSHSQFKSGANYLQTDIAEPDQFSFAVVMRCIYTAAEAGADIAKRGMAFGNFAVGGGIALGYNAATSGALYFGRTLMTESGSPVINSIRFIELADGDIAQWALITGSFGVGSTTRVRHRTKGLTATSPTVANTGAAKGASALRIGSSVATTGQAGPVQISQLRFANVEWSEEEFLQVIAEMRLYEQTQYGRTV